MGTDALSMIKRRFAGREADLEGMYRASESFRGLCADYLTCAAALARWQDSTAADADDRVREYTGLLQELTTEIEEHLPARHGS